jgi:Tat protein translocase TatB subunit
MNIFSNIGITELIVILLLALLVVGPERLPELSRKLGKTLRDVRKAYENLTRDLGPELMSIQKSTQELRESVESVRSIPQDMVQQVVKAADLDETMEELKGVTDSVGEIGKTLSDAGQVIKDPVDAAVSAAQRTMQPEAFSGSAVVEPGPAQEEQETLDEPSAGQEQQEVADGPPVQQEEQGAADEKPAEQVVPQVADNPAVEQEKSEATDRAEAVHTDE